MPSFEQTPNNPSRVYVLQMEIDALRKNKIANTSDPEFAREIQEEIDVREAELQDLQTRH
jgi:FtsZ-binding cell division protein ZapB